MPIQAENPPVQIGSTEVLVGAAISVAGMLRSGVTLTGTPTMSVLPSTAPAPTATSPAVSAGSLTINELSVAAGEAIQFTLTGNSAAKGNYVISWSCGTSNSSTLTGTVNLKIV